MPRSPENSAGDMKHIMGLNSDIEAITESQRCTGSSIGAGRAVEDREENAHFVYHKLQCAANSGFCCARLLLPRPLALHNGADVLLA